MKQARRENLFCDGNRKAKLRRNRLSNFKQSHLELRSREYKFAASFICKYMILKDIFNFLTELKANNNREWFEANKPRYQMLREFFLETVGVLIKEIGSFDSDIFWLEPKDCVFRINRDVRFSANKDPYKTNFAAGFAKGGKKGNNAFYYLHLEPNHCSLNGGIWMPEAEIMKKIRFAIYENTAEFLEIINGKSFVAEFGGLSQAHKLKNVPRGFDKEFVEAELLKLKSFTVTKNCEDSYFTDKNFIANTKKTFDKMYPLIQFLNKAVSSE